MSLLEVYNLNFLLNGKSILTSISFSADRAHTVVLLGPNGAGKTTLLKTIMGLTAQPKHTPNANTIFFNNRIINTLHVHERVEQGLLYLPQQTSLFQHMTVQDNLTIVFQYHDYWKHKSKNEFQAEALHWLTSINLMHALKQKAGTLSGGQKRKLEVVRSLLMKPKMLMLDEPFAGVDPKSIYELKTIFQDLTKTGIGIVISDHHVDQLLSIGQTVYVIVGGQVVISGGIKDVLENTYTKESYLGTQFYQEIAQKFL